MTFAAYLLGATLLSQLPGGPLGVGEPVSAWLDGLGDAAQAQSDGDFGRAEASARVALAARSTGEAGTRARLALGLALRGEGRFPEAAGELAGAVEAADRVVRSHVRAALADALFHARRPGEAAALFRQVAMEASGPISESARWREADAFLEAGLAGPAARAYESVLAAFPGHPSAPRARLGLAAAYRLLGQDQRAVDQYRQVWLENPGEEGYSAGRTLRQWREAGGPIPEPSAADHLARAERLLGEARARRVLALLDELDATLAPSRPLPRSRLLRALALLQLGRYGEGEGLALSLVVELEPRDRPAAELVLARTSARHGRVEEASERYRRIASAGHVRVPGLSPQQLRDLPNDAAYLTAWLYYDAGRYAEAVERLGQFLRHHARSHRTEDARWFRAWSLYRMRRRTEAARALAALQRGPLREAALYWQARLAASPRRAAALYRAAITASQGGWYGLLAAARLSGPGRSVAALPAPPPSRPLGEISGKKSAPFLRATALFGLGLREEALAELSSLGRRPGRAAPLVAQLAEFAGDGEIPLRMARDHMLPTPRALRWSHPQLFPKVLPASAAGFGVDPLLLLAVMRRESSFRPSVRSQAAAEGLLQLLPPTAERLVTVLGVPPGLERRLAEPEVSVRLGAYYLGLLTARFGDPAVVLTAYNAGPVAAAGWAHQRAGLPLDEWVEDIPYRETRRYVRIVMSDYALYRRLHGYPPLRLDPERGVEDPPPGISF